MKYLLILLAFSFASSSQATYDLKVTVTNIEEIAGTLEIGLYDESKTFLSEDVFKGKSETVKNKTVTVIFKEVPKGKYAISLYQDVNNNGICDRNMLGIPKEPYGFSNNFKPRFSKPKFENCAFEMNADKEIEIALIR